MQRRRFLHAVAASGALALAGCSGDESNPFGEDTGTTPGDGGADGDGSVIGGDESDGDGAGGDGGGATATTAGGGTGADGGGDGGTGGTDTGGDATATDTGGDGTATDTGSDGTATATDTGGDGTQTTVSTFEGPTIGGLDPTFEASFRFTVDWSDYEQAPADASMEGAWHEGNFRGEFTARGETIQLYQVSGQSYLVADGSCTPLNSYSSGVDTEEWVGPEETEQRFQNLFEREADGQTTIDGESMYVFRISASELDAQADVTYYLSAETGLLRRVETQGVVLEYWDWGQVPPIEAPC